MQRNRQVLELSTVGAVNANDVRGRSVKSTLLNDNDCIYMIHIREDIDLCLILVCRGGV